MHATPRRATVACLVAGIAFGAGALVATLRGWGSPAVEVEVVNSSGKPVRAVTLAYETCERRGRIDAGALAQGASMRLQFVVCGEAGYRLHVAFDDGTHRDGADEYAERGDRHAMTVAPDGIVVVRRGWRWF